MSTEGPNTQFGGDFDDDIFSFEPVSESLSKEHDSDKEELAVEPKKTTEAATKIKPFISSQPISMLPLPSDSAYLASYESYLLKQFTSNEESNEEKKNRDRETFKPHTPEFRKRRVHPQGL